MEHLATVVWAFFFREPVLLCWHFLRCAVALPMQWDLQEECARNELIILFSAFLGFCVLVPSVVFLLGLIQSVWTMLWGPGAQGTRKEI
jgi:hypothetical protein